jgi:hypothetical protein
MRRLLVAVALCCAQAGAGAQATRARIVLPGYRDPFPIEDATADFTVDASLRKTWDAVVAVFDDYGVPLTMADTVRWTVGNGLFNRRTTFAGALMSHWLDCGGASMGTPNADHYRLSLVLLALLDADGPSKTRLRIGFIGGGVDEAATSIAVSCGSRGTFEIKMFEAVKKKLLQ